jgi:hypothetical protein
MKVAIVFEADVTGSFKSRGPFAAEGFKDWIESLG